MEAPVVETEVSPPGFFASGGGGTKAPVLRSRGARTRLAPQGVVAPTPEARTAKSPPYLGTCRTSHAALFDATRESQRHNLQSKILDDLISSSKD